jgi:hypothetical protein
MRAPCRACYRESALTRRGLVWWHRAYGYLSVSLGPCPGAGRPPYGVLGEAVAPLLGQRVHPEPWRRESRGHAGTCYLLHFDAPFGHARHYLGWASPGNLAGRLAHHAAGSGSNLLRHVAKAGIGWELTRTWPGDRNLERRLKNRGGHARLCPACSPARPPGQPGYVGV